VALLALCVARGHAADQRTFSEQAGYALQIGGETEYVQLLQGGSPVGQVVEEKTATDGWIKKHIGGVAVEDVRAHIRPDQFSKFLSDSLASNSHVDGAMYLLSGMGQVAQERSLTHMMLNELSIPALNGSSKDALYLQIGLAVDQSNLLKGGTLNPPKIAPHTKNVLNNSFVVTIPGLPTARIAGIGPISIHRKLNTDAIGEMRDYQKHPVAWDVSNIVFYVAAPDAQKYLDWQEDFVVKGNRTSDKEKTLKLELKAADMNTTILTLNALGVGIVSAKYTAASAATESIMRLRVEVYAEKMTLDPGKATANAQPTNDPKPDPKADSRGTIRRPTETPLRGRAR